MRLSWLQHVPFEGLGEIEPWAKRRHHSLTPARLWAGDEPPPPSAFDGLIVMGGPMSVHDESSLPWLVGEKSAIERALHADRPVLGVCLGAQLIADVLGAEVRPNAEKEIGWFPVSLTPEGRRLALFDRAPDRFEAFHWHGETFDIPRGATHAASSQACPNQAFVQDSRVLALQFHLETRADGVAALIENCASDLVDGPYVQTAEAMTRKDDVTARTQPLLEGMLDWLFTAP